MKNMNFSIEEAFNLYHNSNYFVEDNSNIYLKLIMYSLIIIIVLFFLLKRYSDKKNKKYVEIIGAVLAIIMLANMFVFMPLQIGIKFDNLHNKIIQTKPAFEQIYLRYNHNQLSEINQKIFQNALGKTHELFIEKQKRQINNNATNNYKELQTCYSWNYNNVRETYCLSNENSETNKEDRDYFEKFLIVRYIYQEKNSPRLNEW